MLKVDHGSATAENSELPVHHGQDGQEFRIIWDCFAKNDRVDKFF